MVGGEHPSRPVMGLTKQRRFLSLEQFREVNPDAMLVDGFGDALAGFDTKGKAIYFVAEIIGILMERDGMSEEEALEFFDLNIEGAYVGEFTPLYMYERG